MPRLCKYCPANLKRKLQGQRATLSAAAEIMWQTYENDPTVYLVIEAEGCVVRLTPVEFNCLALLLYDREFTQKPFVTSHIEDSWESENH